MAGTSSHKWHERFLGRGGQWLELSIILPASGAPHVGEVLVGLGSPGIVEETMPKGTHTPAGRASTLVKLIAAFPLEQVTDGLLRQVRQCLDDAGPEVAALATLSMQLTSGSAWVEQWKRFYRPFKVGRRLVIRPPWEPYGATADEIVLTLNPGQAFGTGLHATTQLCLQLLDRMSCTQPGLSLLDIGCGSGILSLAAVLFGFREALGVDIDGAAVQVARANSRLNHLSRQVAFETGSLELATSRFEVIVANILLEPLLAMLKPLHSVLTPGGVAILSGVLSSEVRPLHRALGTQGWRLTHQTSQEEWAAIMCEEA